MHPHSRNSILKRVADSVIGKSCPICLCQVKIQSAVVLPCMHAYCIGCISRWSGLKRNCPLCNARFSSWFCKINFSSGTFREQRLLPLRSGETVHSTDRDRRDGLLRRQRAEVFKRQRLIRNSRRHSSTLSQNKQLPNRRSFGHVKDEGVDVIHERIKQWRSSIYKKRVWAVPPTRSGLMQRILGSTGANEVLLRRIGPWIQRELQAVLEDPDPTVIVHVATSLFISIYEKKNDNFRGQGVESDFLAPLRPFLHEHADLFWHELRCFAESSFSMEAYDKISIPIFNLGLRCGKFSCSRQEMEHKRVRWQRVWIDHCLMSMSGMEKVEVAVLGRWILYFYLVEGAFSCRLILAHCSGPRTKMDEGKNYEMCIKDLRDETWGLVKPSDSWKVTPANLLACNKAAW